MIKGRSTNVDSYEVLTEGLLSDEAEGEDISAIAREVEEREEGEELLAEESEESKPQAAPGDYEVINDSIRMYLHEVGRVALLKGHEEKALCREMELGRYVERIEYSPHPGRVGTLLRPVHGVGRRGKASIEYRSGTDTPMKLAAIDLGSNSLHMVIVEVSASGGFEVIDREKEMVRLASSTLARGRLSAAAMRDGLDVLRRYQRIAANHGVDQVLAVATSAVREAGNGEDFLERIGREIGICPRAISGEEEARLIYLAALHSIHLEGRRALVGTIWKGYMR